MPEERNKSRKLWSREELIIAFNLYLKLPFGRLHSRTSEIISLASIINRTPSSVAMRLNNFASVDPYHIRRGIIGLTGGKRQVQPIWDEFANNKEELIFLSEQMLADFENIRIEDKYTNILIGTDIFTGEDRIKEIKVRVNQHIFRQIVLANYSSRCSISGINIPELLVASHIIPWSQNSKERLNPENGICLSPLYDQAFEKGFIAIDLNYKIIFSKRLKEKIKEPFYNNFFKNIEGMPIQTPSKYLPNKDFLNYRLNIFEK